MKVTVKMNLVGAFVFLVTFSFCYSCTYNCSKPQCNIHPYLDPDMKIYDVRGQLVYPFETEQEKNDFNDIYAYFKCLENKRKSQRVTRSDMDHRSEKIQMDPVIESKPFYSLYEYVTNNNGSKGNEIRGGKILANRHKMDYTNTKYKAGREFLEAYNSINPVVTLVDFTKESRTNAANFIRAVHNIHPKVEEINFELMVFNATGVSAVLETTKNNRTKFLELLEHNEPTPKSNLGAPEPSGTAAFFATLNAAKLLSSKGAMLMFVDRNIIDEDISFHAGQFLRNRSIKFYVIWGGVFPTPKEEYKLLIDLCDHTDGKFIINADSNLSEYYKRQFLENGEVSEKVSLLMEKLHLSGSNNISFPIDSAVTGIRITINPNITSGILLTPSGEKIDLLDSRDVEDYGRGSFIDSYNGQYDIHINTTLISSEEIGIWNLTLRNSNVDYNVTIYVFAKLTAHTYVYRKANLTDPKKSLVNIVKLDLKGEASIVKDVMFYERNGLLISDNKEKPHQVVWQKHAEDLSVADMKNTPVQIKYPVKKIPEKPFYAVINGQDNKGHKFLRLSYVNPNEYKEIFPRPPLTIDVGENSDLLISNLPTSRPTISFEVTNHGTKVVDLQFSVSDEKYLLLSLVPLRMLLSPQETKTVTLTLAIRPGSYSNLITFTAYGSETIQKRVIVDVGNANTQNDRTEPELNWKYTSDCTDILLGKCDAGTWTIEVKAKDTGLGLLQLTTNPKGIYFPDGFTSGTREEITGYYSDSCCNADLQIMAIDRAKNRAIRNANAYRTLWSAGAIAALVLGILVFIIFLVVVGVAIYKCMKERDTFELPTYRGTSYPY